MAHLNFKRIHYPKTTSLPSRKADNRGEGKFVPAIFMVFTEASYGNVGVRLIRSKGVHIGEAEVAGAVFAVGGGFLASDDGEGRVDVADVVAVGNAVEVEEYGVELGAELQAAVVVPDEGLASLA